MNKLLSAIIICFISFFCYADNEQSVAEIHARNLNPQQQEVAQFIKKLADQAGQVLKDSKKIPEKESAALLKILKENFDLDRISRSVLRGVKPTEDFKNAYAPYLVKTYYRPNQSYSGKLVINSVATLKPSEYCVNADIKTGSSAPGFKVSYWVAESGNSSYKIFDILVEGVSFVSTNKTEFATILNNNGNDLSILIDKLKEKTRPM